MALRERLAVRVVIGMNDSEAPCECGACDEPLTPPIGPLLFIEGTHEIVCGTCAIDYVPGLVIMLGHWWQSATDTAGVSLPSDVAAFYGACLDEHMGSKGTKRSTTTALCKH